MDEDDVYLERSNIDFVVAKSMRYHAYRRAFWDLWNNTSKMITIVSGSAVLVTLVGEYKFAAICLAIVVALMSASDVILGFSQNARIHDALYRAFSVLAQEIADNEQPDKATISRWRRCRLEIEMDEPFVVDLLERRCSGEEARARGLEENPEWKLNRFQTAFSQWWLMPAFRRNDLPKTN